MQERSFKSQIIINLKNNGFPLKKVAFDLEKLYEMADQKGESLNKILDELIPENIMHDKTPDKIIFYRNEQNPELSAKLKQAREILDQMDPQELEQMKTMFMQMSDEEKTNEAKQFKELGTNAFKAKNYSEAIKQYLEAVSYFEAETEFAHEQKLASHLNLSLCYYYTKEYKESLDHATKVI